ncbi:MAG TPA: ATP-binding cassette domain-containing protein, partial [Thermoplasmata archaeon]|nr:ATP-binding cassette domain-containing protein [Thermoplasmata archaeon]
MVLDVQDLKTYFFTYDGVVRALDGVNLTVRRGETTGLVGETGCGKSVTAFSIARLVSEPGRVMSGKITFRGANLLWGLEKEAKYRRVAKSNRVKVSRSFRRIKAANERLASVRGRGIAMIFQEPSAAMNPVFSIWDQVGEALLLHRGIEIVDGLLAADRAWGESRGLLGSDVEYSSGASEIAHAGGGHAATTAAIAALVHAALAGDQLETRAAADRLGETVSLPTLAPEAFYTVRNMGMDAELLRRRVLRSLRRVPLTRMQRNYLRLRRRQMVLDAELGQVSFREMKTGKPFRFQRRAIQLRKLRSRLRGSYF